MRDPGDPSEQQSTETLQVGAWVTRAVGGPEDGRIQVRCRGSHGRIPSLVLEASQVDATLAAIRGKDRVIDFGQVARRTADTLWRQRPFDASFGYFTCDTCTTFMGHRAGAACSALPTSA